METIKMFCLYKNRYFYVISWLGPHKTTLEVADGGRKGHCLLTDTDLSVCLQGSHKDLLQHIHYCQQGCLFFGKRVLTTQSSMWILHLRAVFSGIPSYSLTQRKLSTVAYVPSLHSRYTLLIIWSFIVFFFLNSYFCFIYCIV